MAELLILLAVISIRVNWPLLRPNQSTKKAIKEYDVKDARLQPEFNTRNQCVPFTGDSHLECEWEGECQ